MDFSTVTRLSDHPRRAGRILVDLDDERLGAVSFELVGALGLAVGMPVSAELRARLEAGVRAIACYDKALDTLARRARSRADLGRWLRQREFTPIEIEPALDKLVALGLLDDVEFARGFARSRLLGRGFGPRRVAAELARRGVARSVVDQVLAESAADNGTDEQATVAALVAKRARSVAGLEPHAARRRLAGYLARRGFAMDIIRDALQRLP